MDDEELEVEVDDIRIHGGEVGYIYGDEVAMIGLDIGSLDIGSSDIRTLELVS